MNEERKRSALKSILWRLLGVIILATITYLYTRRWITTGIITFIHHGIFLVVYYLYERLWARIKLDNKWVRAILKMFGYETLLGFCILGTITYLVTGSWKQMTNITVTYILIKHIVYILNEALIWTRINWGAHRVNHG